jgi:hypothetical protein
MTKRPIIQPAKCYLNKSNIRCEDDTYKSVTVSVAVSDETGKKPVSAAIIVNKITQKFGIIPRLK